MAVIGRLCFNFNLNIFFCVVITCLHDFCRISLLLICLCDSIQLLFPNACDLLLRTKLSEEKKYLVLSTSGTGTQTYVSNVFP